MPDRRTRNRVTRRLAVFGPAAIVVLTGILSYASLQRLRSTRQRVQHTHDVLDASSRVLTSLLDAETGTRGFILTHDSLFLAPAKDAPDRGRDGLSDLRALTGDNARQRARVDTLAGLASRRFLMLDSAQMLERQGDKDIVAYAVRSNGPALMADSRRLVAAIEHEEDSLLTVRRADEHRSLALLFFVIILGALTAALLAFFVNRNFDRALLDRRLALEDAELANEQLQHSAIELEQQAIEAEQATEHARDAMVAAEQSEQRTERLQVATEALAIALDVTEVAQRIVDQAVGAVRADSGVMAVVDADKRQLRVVAVRNTGERIKIGTTVSLDDALPINVAFHGAHPVLLSSRDEMLSQYPDLASWQENDGVQAVGIFPMTIDADVTGVLVVRFNRAHEMDVADRSFMLVVSRIAAEAFERARLFAAEHSAREAAEGANRAKAAFLASMSHELRTPLQAALGFAQLVRSGVYGAVNEKQAEALGRVERSQTHLARLIDDILDFARLEAGRVRIDSTPVKVADLIADLGPLVEPQAARKKIELALATPVDGLAVMGDRHRLQQVLVNIVGNAIKFTPEHGSIRIGASTDGATAAILVHDTGIGIPANRLSAIFEPFVQVEDSLTRTASGAGLGLAISRDLTRAMGGDLRVESELGRGSTFTIVLPLAT